MNLGMIAGVLLAGFIVGMHPFRYRKHPQWTRNEMLLLVIAMVVYWISASTFQLPANVLGTESALIPQTVLDFVNRTPFGKVFVFCALTLVIAMVVYLWYFIILGVRSAWDRIDEE